MTSMKLYVGALYRAIYELSSAKYKTIIITKKEASLQSWVFSRDDYWTVSEL